MRLQVYVPDELGARIAGLAENDRRSVSEWVALFLEDRLPAPMEVSDPADVIRPATRSSTGPQVCTHQRVKKEGGTAGGIVKVCLDCGQRGLR